MGGAQGAAWAAGVAKALERVPATAGERGRLAVALGAVENSQAWELVGKVAVC